MPSTSARGEYSLFARWTKTIYSVDVSAADPYGAMIAVTIMVTNMDEEGTVTLSTEDPRVGTAITATLTDPDGSVTGPTWQWARSSDGSTWTDITEATDTAYAPVAADEGNYLRATASYTDGEGLRQVRVRDVGQRGDCCADTRVPLLVEYDPNADDVIDKADMRRAVADYFGAAANADQGGHAAVGCHLLQLGESIPSLQGGHGRTGDSPVLP